MGCPIESSEGTRPCFSFPSIMVTENTELRQVLQNISTYKSFERLPLSLQKLIAAYCPDERVNCHYSNDPWGTSICNFPGDCTACQAMSKSPDFKKYWYNHQYFHQLDREHGRK